MILKVENVIFFVKSWQNAFIPKPRLKNHGWGCFNRTNISSSKWGSFQPKVGFNQNLWYQNTYKVGPLRSLQMEL